jgi:hypothetical protein
MTGAADDVNLFKALTTSSTVLFKMGFLSFVFFVMFDFDDFF